MDAPRDTERPQQVPMGGKAAYEISAAPTFILSAVMNKDFTLSRYALKDGERNMSTVGVRVGAGARVCARARALLLLLLLPVDGIWMCG